MRYDGRRPVAARTLRRLDGKWPTAPLSYHLGQARPECQRRYVRNITSSSVKENHLATLFLFERSSLISFSYLSRVALFPVQGHALIDQKLCLRIPGQRTGTAAGRQASPRTSTLAPSRG